MFLIFYLDKTYFLLVLVICEFNYFQHGESEFNVIGRIGGDAALSPRGRMYSQSLAKHICALNLPSLQIWTSTLQRTKATSANIQAPQQHLHELDEIWSVSTRLDALFQVKVNGKILVAFTFIHPVY